MHVRELRKVLIGVEETTVDRAVRSSVRTSLDESLHFRHGQFLNESRNPFVRVIHDRKHGERGMSADVWAFDRMTNRVKQIGIRRGTDDHGVKLRARHTHLRGYAVQKRDAKRLHGSWREDLTEPVRCVERHVRASNKDDHFPRGGA